MLQDADVYFQTIAKYKIAIYTISVDQTELIESDLIFDNLFELNGYSNAFYAQN